MFFGSWCHLDSKNALNRTIRASKEIPKSTKLADIKPIASVIKASDRRRVCEACFDKIEKRVECNACRFVWYCSDKCWKKHKKGDHKNECKFIQKAKGVGRSGSQLTGSLQGQFGQYQTGLISNDLMMGFRMFNKCYLQKDKKAQSCLNKLFFTFDLPDFSDKLSIAKNAITLLYSVSDLIQIEANRKEGYISKCMLILTTNPKQLNNFFGESAANFREMLTKKGDAHEDFYRHDFGIFQRRETNMRVALGRFS